MNQNAAGKHLPPDVERHLVQLSGPPSVDDPLPGAASSAVSADRLIGIGEIRAIFGLGRTAAYELTHRPSFPAPVRISPRCYRWWAAEVAAFAASLRQQQARPVSRQRSTQRRALAFATVAPRISGKVRTAKRRKEAQ
jgi:predicted DNA-binding transcriptional regulator AlpA